MLHTFTEIHLLIWYKESEKSDEESEASHLACWCVVKSCLAGCGVVFVRVRHACIGVWGVGCRAAVYSRLWGYAACCCCSGLFLVGVGFSALWPLESIIWLGFRLLQFRNECLIKTFFLLFFVVGRRLATTFRFERTLSPRSGKTGERL